MANFICIAFVVAKLKVFRNLRTESKSMEGLFLSVSRPLLPNYILASITTKLFEICTGGSNLTDKNSV